MKPEPISAAITRRDFVRASSAIAASALAAGFSSATQAADSPVSPLERTRAGKAAAPVYPHPLLTPAEKFRDVSRGNPKPFTLIGDARPPAMDATRANRWETTWIGGFVAAR